MRYLAFALGAIPGLVGFVMDPDFLRIGFLVVFLLASYVAWRTKIVGGIVLILVGAAMLIIFFINLSQPHHWSPMDILGWTMFVSFPATSGLLFIAAGKKRRPAQKAKGNGPRGQG